MVLGGEEGLVYEFVVEGSHLEHVVCIVDGANRNEVEYRRKGANGRIVEGAIRSLENGKDSQLQDPMVPMSLLYLF